MIKIRKNYERGVGEFGWLHSKHSFSFGQYYDENFMGFRNLRVINEDKVEPSQGFGSHGHKNMEILTFVISGQLEHKDSLGNGSVLTYGEIQLMSAGLGIQHSEFNPSSTERVHFLQIWIEPSQINSPPSYSQKNFLSNSSNLILMVSQSGENQSLKIKQDVKIYRGLLNQNELIHYKIEKNRFCAIQIVKGQLKVFEENILQQGDGIQLNNFDVIPISTDQHQCEFLLFDLN